jgi:hypothetical protein
MTCERAACAPLERWAGRRPGARYPLVLLTLLLLIGLAGGITGCGGGSDEPDPTVLATGQSTAHSGDERTGAAVLVLPLPGPTVQLDTAATVRVHITGTATIAAHYAAAAQAGVALQHPVPSGATTVAAPLLPRQTTSVAIDYTVLIALPAGDTPLQALLTLRAVDASNGLPTGALATADAAAEWEVTLP